MSNIVRVAGLAFAISALMAPSAIAAEYQCQLDGSALRLATEVKKRGHTLPCEVVAEDEKDGRVVLHNAQYDREFCPRRLEYKRAELEAEGWSCTKTSETNIVRGTGEIGTANLLASSDEPETQLAEVATPPGRVCRQGGETRRLNIQVDDPSAGTPCQLVYWAEDDGTSEGQLLWRAEHDANFCTNRLSFIVEKWEGEGWACEVSDDLPIQSAAVSIPVEEEVAPAAPSIEETEVAIEAEMVIEAEPAPEAVEEQEVAAAVEAAAPISLEAEPAPEVSNTINKAILESIVDADARRIGQWMEVEPNIEIAAEGDLNADGTEDAVVFLAYESDQSAYRQYMMSYLVTDETYELASVKLLTGANPPPAQPTVQAIEDGVIWLSLPDADAEEGGSIGFVLRDQQLVEVNPEDRAESASN